MDEPINSDKQNEDNIKLDEIYNELFKDKISKDSFNKKIDSLGEKQKEQFKNACDYFLFSERITSTTPKKDSYIIDPLRYQMLFIVIETLMCENDFKPFQNWLIDILKKRDIENEDLKTLLETINIQNKNNFKKLIKRLDEIYIEQYGVTNKIRTFFNKYIDFETKKELILSFKFYNYETKEWAPKCFISKDMCINDDISCNKLICDFDCKLEDNEKFKKDFNEFIGFLYGCYRNKLVHEGERHYLPDDKWCITYDCVGTKLFETKLTYNQLKEIILKGIKQYLLQ